MCAVDDGASGGAMPVSVLSLESLSGGEEGSSSISSLEDSELDHQAARASTRSKIKMMCSYGGRILPRPHDGQLRYMGGETRILVVKKEIGYKDLMAKLSHLVAGKGLLLKYQLPNEDLDALVSVTSDEDVKNMMDEFDKVANRSGERGGAPVKLRVFLFPSSSSSSSSLSAKSPLFDQPGVLEYSSDESVMDPASSSGSASKMNSPLLATFSNSSSANSFPRKSKIARPQPRGGDHEFGSLKAFQRKQQDHHQWDHFEPGMFYNQPDHLQHHHQHQQFFDGRGDSCRAQLAKPPPLSPPCHCCAVDQPSCSSSSSMLPPRHPLQRYHHPSPVRSGHSINEAQAHNFSPRYYPSPHSYSQHHHLPLHHHHHHHHLYNNA